MLERAKRLMDILCEKGIEAALITKPDNMRYFTGYTGEGCLLILKNRLVICTDFRYVEQVSIQAPGCECVQTRVNNVTPQTAARDIFAAEGVTKVAFEPYRMTVADFEAWKKEMPAVEFVSLENIPEQKLRIVKDAGEIEAIAKAGAIACKAFDELLGWVKPGMTEMQVKAQLEYFMLSLGSEGVAFGTIAASGPNGSLPHAVPGLRKIEQGDLLTLDFGAKVNGYCCDMTRTIGFGNVSDELRAIYNAVLEAQLIALEMIGPGVICKDVDAAAREYLEARYPGGFGHSLGHGVGLVVHEAPGLNMRDESPLVPGHVVTVEPGVYLPGLGGVRIEDMALITENGYINPITAPKQLILL